jgi:hypothetical protein
MKRATTPWPQLPPGVRSGSPFARSGCGKSAKAGRENACRTAPEPKGGCPRPTGSGGPGKAKTTRRQRVPSYRKGGRKRSRCGSGRLRLAEKCQRWGCREKKVGAGGGEQHPQARLVVAQAEAEGSRTAQVQRRIRRDDPLYAAVWPCRAGSTRWRSRAEKLWAVNRGGEFNRDGWGRNHEGPRRRGRDAGG